MNDVFFLVEAIVIVHRGDTEEVMTAIFAEVEAIRGRWGCNTADGVRRSHAAVSARATGPEAAGGA